MKFFIISVLLFTCQLLSAQSKPGLYLTMNYELELCEHKLKLINDELVYCLSREPVLEFDLFDKVEELVYDSLYGMRKFRILLSTKGQDFVSTIAKKLPGHDLALVVDGVLVSIIRLEGVHHPRSIIIWDHNDSQAMEWLHQSLVKTVTKHNKKS